MRSKRWAYGVVVLLVGALALTQMACPSSQRRTPAQVQSDIDQREQRRDQIRQELEDYGHDLDPETNEWRGGMAGPLSLTPHDAQAHIRDLRSEWQTLNNSLRDLREELHSSQQAHSRPENDVSRHASGAGSRVTPPTTPTTGSSGCGGHP